MMKVYFGGFITILVSWLMYGIFTDLKKIIKNERYEKFADVFLLVPIVEMIIFWIYNILVYSVYKNINNEIINILTILYIVGGFLFIVCILLAYFTAERTGIEFCFVILTMLVGGLYLIFAILLCFGNCKDMELFTIEEYSKYSYTIEIEELTEVPYTNITGEMYYIRSEPSLAYYYDIRTENGNTTTKVIDGNEYYVEKDEDDKYLENPHIDVYEVVKKYYTWGDEQKEDVLNYYYIICVPENSIYYEKSQ